MPTKTNMVTLRSSVSSLRSYGFQPLLTQPYLKASQSLVFNGDLARLNVENESASEPISLTLSSSFLTHSETSFSVLTCPWSCPWLSCPADDADLKPIAPGRQRFCKRRRRTSCCWPTRPRSSPRCTSEDILDDHTENKLHQGDQNLNNVKKSSFKPISS
jgi:hypothetical protein